jgi:hypothetical protein
MKKGYSLHIGVNFLDEKNYGTKGELQCCEADAKSFLEIANQAGYSSQVLLSKDATSNNVLSVFNDFVEKAEPEDIVFITYSGHGSQIWDLNDDEEDYLDETWCLYDRQLIDDEIYKAYSDFKEGVKVIVISDSCHSGTVLKAVSASINTIENYTKRTINTLGENRNFEKNKELYKNINSNLKGVESRPVKADVRLFAACQDNQTALEFNGHGAFTASLLKAYEAIGEESISYKNFFLNASEITVAITNNHQRPNLFKYGIPQTNWGTPFTI